MVLKLHTWTYLTWYNMISFILWLSCLNILDQLIQWLKACMCKEKLKKGIVGL